MEWRRQAIPEPFTDASLRISEPIDNQFVLYLWHAHEVLSKGAFEPMIKQFSVHHYIMSKSVDIWTKTVTASDPFRKC